LFDSWPQKLIIERVHNGDVSSFIHANENVMPFVIFEPQESDKENYSKLVKFLSEKNIVIFFIYIYLFIYLFICLFVYLFIFLFINFFINYEHEFVYI